MSWALRLIGRRNMALNTASVALAKKLAASPDPAARWIGKGAVKELTSAAVQRRLKTVAARPTGRSKPRAAPGR